MILAPEKLTALIDHFSQTLAVSASFEVDGVERAAEFEVIVKGRVVKVLVQLDAAVSGTVSNIKLLDDAGLCSCSTSKTFIKPAGKKQYAAFTFEFKEKVV